tara:strand:+ start:106 stop:303 length:198 start_codon:yes stop_codon:yes gene_type:complete
MSRMNWGELLELLNKKCLSDPLSLQDSVTVYDSAAGEYYPADLIVFEESDGIIDAETMFVSINAE